MKKFKVGRKDLKEEFEDLPIEEISMRHLNSEIIEKLDNLKRYHIIFIDKDGSINTIAIAIKTTY